MTGGGIEGRRAPGGAETDLAGRCGCCGRDCGVGRARGVVGGGGLAGWSSSLGVASLFHTFEINTKTKTINQIQKSTAASFMSVAGQLDCPPLPGSSPAMDWRILESAWMFCIR